MNHLIEKQKVALNFYLFVITKILESVGNQREILETFYLWATEDLLMDKFPEVFIALDILDETTKDKLEITYKETLKELLTTPLMSFPYHDYVMTIDKLSLAQERYGDLSENNFEEFSAALNSSLLCCLSEHTDSLMIKDLLRLKPLLEGSLEELSVLETFLETHG